MKKEVSLPLLHWSVSSAKGGGDGWEDEVDRMVSMFDIEMNDCTHQPHSAGGKKDIIHTRDLTIGQAENMSPVYSVHK